jgi:hypothetical protein
MIKQTITIAAEPQSFVVERQKFYSGWPVYSQAFICPVCLELWAIVGDKPYQLAAIPCENHPLASHPILSPVPGSILDNSTFAGDFDQDLARALPNQLLEREFNLHVAALELIPDERPNPTLRNLADEATDAYHRALASGRG